MLCGLEAVIEAMLCCEAPFVCVAEPVREIDNACGSLEIWVSAEFVNVTESD